MKPLTFGKFAVIGLLLAAPFLMAQGVVNPFFISTVFAPNDCAKITGPNSVGSIGSSCAAAAPVQSVFGRTGAVVSAASDYSFSQLSGALACAQMVALTGDITTSACASTLATVNSNTGSFGSATQVPQFTVNGKGLITAVSNVTIAIPFTALTGSLACGQHPALTGDATSSAGSCTTTVVKVNGIAYAATAAIDTIPVITVANTTATYTALVNCVGNGNALQYATATHTFSCSASSGTVTSVSQTTGIIATPNPIIATGTIGLDPAYHRGMISGCNTSGATTTLTINPCVATDDGPTDIMLQSSTYTKTFAAWAVGTASGGLDTGSIAASTWYHVYQIKRPDTGVVDYLISLSATAPTMPTNYTRKRRIASIKTNATPNIISYVQDGDLFQWSTDVQDISSVNPGGGAVTRTLASVPSGVRNEAIVSVGCVGTAIQNDLCAVILLSDLSVTDQAPTTNTSADLAVFSAGLTTNNQMAVKVRVMTNTSQQIRSRVAQTTANTTLTLTTHGWTDTRGRWN